MFYERFLMLKKYLTSLFFCCFISFEIHATAIDDSSSAKDQMTEQLSKTKIKHKGTGLAEAAQSQVMFGAAFLKVTLLATETSSWAMETFAHLADPAGIVHTAGMASLHAGLGHGASLALLHAGSIGLLQIAAGAAMANPFTAAGIMTAAIISAELIGQWKDRIDKTETRMSALRDLSEQLPKGTKSSLLNTGLSYNFVDRIKASSAKRSKYSCKRIKAIQHANNLRKVSWCLYNASPVILRDYMCEVLGNLKDVVSQAKKGKLQTLFGKNHFINAAAPIFKDALVSTYRNMLKYRFLDKFYTSIHDVEGLAQINSWTTAEDKLNASEFWTIESNPKLLSVLQGMNASSPLMKSINSCNSLRCDRMSPEDKKHQELYLDDHALNLEEPPTPYVNYCDYYFSKSPLHLNMAKEHTKDEYAAAKIDRAKAIRANAIANFDALFLKVQGLDEQTTTGNSLASLEHMSQQMEKYKDLLDQLKGKPNKIERQRIIDEWKKQAGNKDAFISVHQVKELIDADTADSSEDANEEEET